MWKSPGFDPFCANLTHFMSKPGMPEREAGGVSVQAAVRATQSPQRWPKCHRIHGDIFKPLEIKSMPFSCHYSPEPPISSHFHKYWLLHELQLASLLLCCRTCVCVSSAGQCPCVQSPPYRGVTSLTYYRLSAPVPAPPGLPHSSISPCTYPVRYSVTVRDSYPVRFNVRVGVMGLISVSVLS